MGHYLIVATIDKCRFSGESSVLVANAGRRTDTGGNQGNRNDLVGLQALGFGTDGRDGRTHDQHTWARASRQWKLSGKGIFQGFIVELRNTIKGTLRDFLGWLWWWIQLAMFDKNAGVAVRVHIRVDPAHDGFARR
ncbi:hypothetical protein D3C87_1677620 [compost metagenome]